MKRLIPILILFVFLQVSYAQNITVKDYLLLGVDAAQDLMSKYTEPADEGLIYAITGGWYNDARVLDKWGMDIALVTNGSFVPSEKKIYRLDVSRFDNLEIVGGGESVDIPTIIGDTKSSVRLAAILDDERFEFDVPTGITGLADINLLPSAFLQFRMGIPYGTEIKLRYFPKLNIDNSELGMHGAAIQHQISNWIEPIKESMFAVSGIVAYTAINADYEFQTGGFVSGTGQHIDFDYDSWLFEMIVSTKYPKYNAYGGVGYITGTSDVAMKGTYVIETQQQTRTFSDPFVIGNNVSGLRANIGGKASFGRFSINIDYTFQGYNNLSLGFNYNIR
ncbi:hypothetical protein SAMN04487906_1251 [Zhouia amylolytica]|uniref:Uncharacterized protein n=2 Tax=Zhouia amylolytica TaxID=376730 RepID=W2UMQ9_9FLAO|nr:DUF6588 family protein [Zhouia amylolytica]ETN95244.1 hypothetical protein P278_19990 [Zhouia amylolytica AD3]SFS67160.1 hypothetical protein SAMN04487906_1251 [Zhouia amylolytica]